MKTKLRGRPSVRRQIRFEKPNRRRLRLSRWHWAHETRGVTARTQRVRHVMRFNYG